ncbi:unnamed protein product, partial [marine sediment metagenome]
MTLPDPTTTLSRRHFGLLVAAAATVGAISPALALCEEPVELPPPSIVQSETLTLDEVMDYPIGTWFLDCDIEVGGRMPIMHNFVNCRFAIRCRWYGALVHEPEAQDVEGDFVIYSCIFSVMPGGGGPDAYMIAMVPGNRDYNLQMTDNVFQGEIFK